MSCITTFSGKNVFFENPKAEDIFIGDIAISLSNLCRYVGHVPKFYSVAEHCVLGLNFIKQSDPDILKAWLMHECAEAYIGDIPSPLKRLLPVVKTIEDNMLGVIAEKYDIKNSFRIHTAVKSLDYSMLKTEAKLVGKKVDTWGTWLDPYPFLEGLELQHWAPDEAEDQFMRAFEELFG